MPVKSAVRPTGEQCRRESEQRVGLRCSGFWSVLGGRRDAGTDQVWLLVEPNLRWRQWQVLGSMRDQNRDCGEVTGAKVVGRSAPLGRTRRLALVMRMSGMLSMHAGASIHGQDILDRAVQLAPRGCRGHWKHCSRHQHHEKSSKKRRTQTPKPMHQLLLPDNRKGDNDTREQTSEE